MKKISMISTALLSSALVACGGSGSPSKPDLCTELNVTNCNQIVIPSSSSSSAASSMAPPVNNILPFTENFVALDAVQLFTSSYKSLLEPGTEDPNPAFYYSTSGLDSGRMAVGGGKMTIGNARMTLGQRLQTTGTHINPAALPVDYKVGTTTDGTAANFPTTSTWGELDLSNPWKISFCVKEFEALSGSASNQQFMVYVDNNTSGSSFSIHGTNSLAKQLNVTNFVAGKRVEINFPGDVFVDGKSIDSVLQNPGTTTSFIQLRVPSAAVITMSELWVGYQSATESEPAAATCTVGERVPGWNVPPPAVDPTVAPAIEVGDSQLAVSWNALERASGYQVAYNTTDTPEGVTPIDVASPLTSYSIKDLQNGTPYFVFYRGKNSAGVFTAWSPSASATPQAAATPPAIPAVPTLVAGDAQIEASWAAIENASSYQVAFNTVDNPATATVFGDPVSTTSIVITGLTNDVPYYVYVRAENAAGLSEYSPAGMATPVAPVATSWTTEALSLVGTSDIAPSGSINATDETALTLTATGGNLSSSAHNIFFAYQEIAKSDFVLTARIASVTGGDIGAGNSYRFGLMVMSDINPVTTYADLAGWASIGFYVSAPQTYVGSRANMKADNTRTRGDIITPNTLLVGDYVRIEVYDDGVNKRVRRLLSKDNGVTFIQINSSTDFKASSTTDNWFVGLYAAPGANTLSIEFDNISVEDYVAPAP